ncbi:MAG: ECF transporter S component [Clostridiales bacterium]|nr:ECF transporter S component [Clostridia bacterium]MBR6965722.1 ECF transporter S component [Clostridia bacterium]MCR5567310.1 ECF transporter S component [Clostridiales bacterium]
MNNRIQSQKVRYMCLIAAFIAIELLLKLSGLGNIPINPVLNVTLLTIPVAIGAILLGPLAGTILGAVFGATSFIQPMSPMVAAFIPISMTHTIILCVCMRALMGFCVGWIFRFFQKLDKKRVFCYFGASFFTAFLNTLFFMGYIILVFYHTDYVTEKVTSLGALNPLHFVILFVGINGLFELVTTTIIGGSVSKGVDYAINRKQSAKG